MFKAVYKLVPSDPHNLRFLDRIFFTLARGMFPGIYQVWLRHKGKLTNKDSPEFLQDKTLLAARRFGLVDFCSFAALSLSNGYRTWLKSWSRSTMELRRDVDSSAVAAFDIGFRGYERRYNCPPPMCRSRLLNVAEQPFKFRRCGAVDCKYCRFRAAVRMHKRVYNIALAFGKKHLLPLLGTVYHLDFDAVTTTEETLRSVLKLVKARIKVDAEVFGQLYNTRIYRVKDKKKGFLFRCSILLAHTPVLDTKAFKKRVFRGIAADVAKVTRSKTRPLDRVRNSAHLFAKAFSFGYYLFFKHAEEPDVLHSFTSMKLRLTRSMSFSKVRWERSIETFFLKRKRLNTNHYVTKFKRLQLESTAAEIPQSTG